MKLGEGESHRRRADLHRARRTCLLTAAGGQCIRFPRDRCAGCLPGRTSMGVARHRAAGERPPDLAFDPAPCRGDLGRALGLPEDAPGPVVGEKRGRGGHRGGCRGGVGRDPALFPSAMSRCRRQEQVVLTVSVNGFRQSARRPTSTVPPDAAAKASSRWSVNNRNGKLVASFPVEDFRPDHAGDRQGPADPLPGRRHPRRRAVRHKG